MKCLSESLVHKGRVISLFKQRVRMPNGYVVNIELIKHPGAVVIVPFLSKEKILLLRQFRPAIKRWLYEVPAGTLKKGEKPLICARRELIEETGFAAMRIIKVGQIFPVPGYSTEFIHIFKAEKLKKHVANTEADELIEVLEVSRRDFLKLFKAGKIVDAKTIAALALCNWI